MEDIKELKERVDEMCAYMKDRKITFTNEQQYELATHCRHLEVEIGNFSNLIGERYGERYGEE